jgi:hypothetical protein
VHGKACRTVTCRARPVAKASETVVTAEVVCHAPNKMDFFEQLGGRQRLSETGSQGQRRRHGPIKLQPRPQPNR